MNEEFDQIEKNQIWELVPRTKDMNIIGTKWIFKNNFNEHERNVEKIQNGRIQTC